jgi:glycosyltransferase involved in cell wall biosynthesis
MEGMRIAAIFNIWADCLDLLPHAIENIRPVVDGVIVVWSKKSNRLNVAHYELPKDCILVQCEPDSREPHHNETAKRNAGLSAARQLGFTHFIGMDSDEFYDQQEFLKEKNIIDEKGILGSVCRIKTYFKIPTLTIGFDHTLVPFIHRIGSRLEYKLKFHSYPYTYDREGKCHIDPTRRLNMTAGVKMVDIVMHHFSWVRKDFKLKMENSSANLRGTRADGIFEDLRNAKPGYFCKTYHKELIECDNQFNLPIYD